MRSDRATTISNGATPNAMTAKKREQDRLWQQILRHDDGSVLYNVVEVRAVRDSGSVIACVALEIVALQKQFG